MEHDSFQAHCFRQKQPRYQRQSEHYIAQNAHHAERYRRSPFHRSKPAGSAVIRLRSIYMALVLSVAVTCAAFLLYQRALHFFSSAEAAFEPRAPRVAFSIQKEVPHLTVRYFCFLVETLLVLTSGLRLLATLHAGAFIMLSLANLGDNACLSAATLETFQCAIDGFAFLDMNLRHLYFPPSETSGLILDA